MESDLTPEQIAWIDAVARGMVAVDVAHVLVSRLDYARARHPEGASFAALVAEVAEAMAEPAESERQRYELIDVAVVAIRMWLGEVEP